MARRIPRQDVCDIFGNRLAVRYYRRRGHYVAVVPSQEPALVWDCGTEDCSFEDAMEYHDNDHRTAHYFRILLDAARKKLTDKQYEAAEQAIVLGQSLHELAAERGGTAEAWRQRIEGSKGCGGIKHKAPELYAVWIFRNRARRDISEVINAIHRAVHRQHSERTNTKPPSDEDQ